MLSRSTIFFVAGASHGCGVAVLWTAFPSDTSPFASLQPPRARQRQIIRHILIIAWMPFAVLGSKAESRNDAKDPDHNTKRDVAEPGHLIDNLPRWVRTKCFGLRVELSFLLPAKISEKWHP